MKRVFLFVITNIAIMLVIGIVMRIFGFDGYLNERGLDYGALAVFSLLWGSIGSFISLALSKTIAKRSMGVHLIENPTTNDELWLIETVQRQAQMANIGMPEVGIFRSDSPNAFATGMNKNKSLVAVSSGLLNHMDKDEIEAVLAHEVSHIANGDMITLSLIQGILNAFVIFFSRVIGYAMSAASRDNGRSGYTMGNFIGTMIAQIVLGFLAAIIVNSFSRWREFHADNGGAKLAGTDKMIKALQALQRSSSADKLEGEFAAFGISGGRSTMARLFSTHPPLEDRIKALQEAQMHMKSTVNHY